ncbi:MAG TPA: universal stress protein, partial [Candidatus Acidoferrales bacterium]|nr:universal stress protein [Candidatus Acidoferrales bacterium]
MYKKILVPLDGSKLAEGVLPYARLLAVPLKLPVDLLYVNDPDTVAPAAYSISGSDYLKQVAALFSSGLAVNGR